MRVIRIPRPAGKRVIALGMFDGVHKGHKALIRTATEISRENGIRLRVCTFDRHPLELLQPDHPPELLSTVPEKAREMCRIGVDEMELIRFNRRMAETEPEEFLAMLRSNTDIYAVVAGWNYSFGYRGRGDADMLCRNGKAFGYRVVIVPPAKMEDGTVISSSLIRQKLHEGRTDEAAKLLGYSYTLTGNVVNGKHQGRKLGFPTANIEPWNRKALPKFGVYTCQAETDGKILPAIVNIGVQPTMPSGKVTVEAHILKEIPELYGSKIRLTLLTMLREERKFNTPEELRNQIQNDRNEAKRLFDMA